MKAFLNFMKVLYIIEKSIFKFKFKKTIRHIHEYLPKLKLMKILYIFRKVFLNIFSRKIIFKKNSKKNSKEKVTKNIGIKLEKE